MLKYVFLNSIHFNAYHRHSPVITSSPSEDHTYSAGVGVGGGSKRSTTNNSDINSNGTSSDAAYESSEERLVCPSGDFKFRAGHFI